MNFVLLAFLFGAPPTTEPPRADIELIAPSTNQAHLHAFWKRRQRAIERGDEERAAQQLDKIVTFQRNAGIKRLDSVARALLHEAASRQDFSLIPVVEQIAPGLPDIYNIEAGMILKKEKFAYHKWIKVKVKALIASMSDFQAQVLFLSEALLNLLLIFSVLIAVFVFTQLIRYSLNVYFDLGRAFPSIAKIVILLTFLISFSIPIFYGFGPFSLIFPLVILFWNYQKTKERFFSLIMLIILALAPWGLRLGNRLTEAGTGYISELSSLTLNPLNQRSFNVIQGAVNERSRDWESKVILGLAQKRRGQLKNAVSLFDSALKDAKGRDSKGLIYNNLGNTYFAMGMPETAKSYYEKSSKALPDSAIPLFNLHRLSARMGNSEDSEKYIQAASIKDSQEVAFWSEDDDINLNRYVIDIDISSEDLTSRTFRGVFHSTPLAKRIWLLIAGPLPEMSAPLSAVIALFAISLLALVRQRMILTWPCNKCGKSSLNALIDGHPEYRLCDECHEIFVQNKPIDRAVRFAKEDSISKFNNLKKFSNMLFSFFPGVVQIAWGRTIEGIFLVGLTIFLIIRIIFPHGILLDPYMLETSKGFSFWSSAILFGLLWLYSLLQTYKLNKELN
ncbi:tetratricopeptide repeat protein [Myxococcota bacterium]|nr:tetratricopeptide repeat protein [Myxococcota bacterium]